MALAEEQRDEALSRVQMLTEKFDQLNSQNGSSIPRGDLRGLSLQKLKGLQVCEVKFSSFNEIIRALETFARMGQGFWFVRTSYMDDPLKL